VDLVQDLLTGRLTVSHVKAQSSASLNNLLTSMKAKENAYVDGAGLHIVPTLTTQSTDITPEQILNGYVLNLTTAGTCTSNDITMCSIRSNDTAGKSSIGWSEAVTPTDVRI
jgi:hypothetical protein